jgi:hypothetical protein
MGTEHRGIEHRQSPRHTVNRPAWVDAGGGAKRDCVLVDISESGARLALEAPAEIPETFCLFLSPGGEVRRDCRIAWRSDKQVGVQFVGVQHRAA